MTAISALLNAARAVVAAELVHRANHGSGVTRAMQIDTENTLIHRIDLLGAVLKEFERPTPEDWRAAAETGGVTPAEVPLGAAVAESITRRDRLLAETVRAETYDATLAAAARPGLVWPQVERDVNIDTILRGFPRVRVEVGRELLRKCIRAAETTAEACWPTSDGECDAVIDAVLGLSKGGPGTPVDRASTLVELFGNPQELRAENERLRAEVERLRNAGPIRNDGYQDP